MSDVDDGARARLDYIEKQLVALFPESYVTFAAADKSGMPASVADLARSGNLLAAIKAYRALTGVSLAEAKAAVEAVR